MLAMRRIPRNNNNSNNVAVNNSPYQKSTLPHFRQSSSLPPQPLLSKRGETTDSNIIRPSYLLCRCLIYSCIVIGVALFILMFGTIYSAVDSRDPCVVLASWKQPTAILTFPKMLHIQSRTNEITKETRTWMTNLNIGETQTYPNIHMTNSQWVHVYWSDEACLSLVRDHFPLFLSTYENFPHNIQRVDSCRYLILSKYGGVYADSDISLHTVELEYLLPPGVGVVESPFRYNENVQNSLMTASEPKHPFFDIVIELIQQRFIESPESILATTGPRMLGDAYDRYNDLVDNKSKSPVQVLPCELFQRLPTGQWDTTFSNILGRELLSRAIPMQGCGSYGDGKCEITRHVGKASWTVESGKFV